MAGTGTSTITYSAPVNDTSEERIGYLRIGGIYLEVRQPSINQGRSLKVYSTGVNDQNQTLAGTQPDPHYRLISTPDTRMPGPTAYTAPSNAWPISGPWLAEDSKSRWLLPERVWLGNAVTYLWPGTYKYRTEFLIAGYDPATVTLSGKWAADNSGRMLVNGQTVNTMAGSAGHTSWTNFSLTGSPLRAGVNLIDFEVTNADTIDSPTGSTDGKWAGM